MRLREADGSVFGPSLALVADVHLRHTQETAGERKNGANHVVGTPEVVLVHACNDVTVVLDGGEHLVTWADLIVNSAKHNSVCFNFLMQS